MVVRASDAAPAAPKKAEVGPKRGSTVGRGGKLVFPILGATWSAAPNRALSGSS
jgi:hypothetical protein